MNTIPIVIPCYNRIDSLNRLLKSLESAIYKDKTPLIFSIDYSGNENLYEFIKKYQWKYGEKRIIRHSKNIGLKENIIFCGNLTEEFEAVIVLEDDLIVAPDFYNYAIQAYNFYKEDNRIAGISLYKYERAEIGYHQFYPIETNFDAYLMEWPSSWGQLWSKEQWVGFKVWLEKANSIDTYNIPDYVKRWDNKSWKKWAVAYVYDTKKFYIYPYKSFTNEFGTIGIHYSKDTSLQNINTVSLFCGINKIYTFGIFEKLPKYDCFFQPYSYSLIINKKLYETTFNIYNCRKKENIETEYVISPIKITNQHIVSSFPSLNYPLELNLDFKDTGTSFFYLYKTIYYENKVLNYQQKLILRILPGTRESLKYYIYKTLKLFFNQISKKF